MQNAPTYPDGSARQRLAATLNAEQLALLRRVEAEVEADANDRMLAETDREFERVCEHFPGQAPALRAVMQHVQEQCGNHPEHCCAE